MKSGPKELAAYHAQVLERQKRMTRTELAELQELGLTEAQLEERRKKLSAQFAEDDNAARKEAMPEQEVPAATTKTAKAERKTITVDLTDAPGVYERIKDCAETDDRTMSTWLRRYLIAQSGI